MAVLETLMNSNSCLSKPYQKFDFVRVSVFLSSCIDRCKQMEVLQCRIAFYFCTIVNMKAKNTIYFALLIVAAGFIRLWIEIPNFSPVAAIALVGGFYWKKDFKAYLLPLSALFITDAILALGGGSYAAYFMSGGMLAVYSAFALTSFMGSRMRRANAGNMLAYGTLSAVAFFLITNFAVWLSGSMYPQTLMGLLECYGAGLAFYRQEVFGSFFLNFWMGTMAFGSIFLLMANMLKAPKPVLA